MKEKEERHKKETVGGKKRQWEGERDSLENEWRKKRDCEIEREGASEREKEGESVNVQEEKE